MKIKSIIRALEAQLPLWLQESWDNSGLQIGDLELEATGVLLAVDPTEAVIEEAIALGYNLVVTHHPLLFKGLKRIGTGSDVERATRLALRHDIAVYSAHTSADNAPAGLNAMLARELGLTDVVPLETLKGSMCELTTFVPSEHLATVQEALWAAGAGRIGAYDSCSYASLGMGTFRPLEGSSPFVGEAGALEQVEEVRLSVVLPTGCSTAVVSALHEAHPYEVPAFSLVPLANPLPTAGSGIVGNLPAPMPLRDYLEHLKGYFATDKLMYAGRGAELVQRVAICGGAGAFLCSVARRAGADLLVTGEAKYNDYLDAEGLTLATVGHFESESVSTRLFYEIISQKFPTFAVRISSIDNNRIKTI